MKSFLKRLSRRLFSLVLCAVMIASTFAGIGFTTSVEADAADETVTIGGITQQRVVSNYEILYRDYQKRFFGGEGTNWPTDFVIPGLGSSDDYTPQGMTYWKAKEWILISAYDAGGSDPSVIYVLDIVTTKFVALFKLKNSNGSYNTGHGGGIAASEYNFYYADSDSKVSYIPLDEMEAAYNNSSSHVVDVTLKDSVDFSAEMKGNGQSASVKTSYCCYDEGVLWTGNFYYSKDNNYNQPFDNTYPSVLMGYRLRGYSSAQEWENLKNGTFTPDTEKYKGCAGDPSYVIGFNFDKIQYAMVDKGKLYVSRSWKRTWSENHTRELTIADIDINSPGSATTTIAGKERDCHWIKYDDCTHFGGDNGAAADKMNQMLWMGEALCVIDDYLYMFGEGAAWTYNGKDSGNKCGEPIDVIWKIDQYAIQDLDRPFEDVLAVEYQKVNSFDDINPDDEYIVLHESPLKDPVTQDNILYLLDSFGGYDYRKLPKKANASSVTQANTGDSMGVIGYEIRDYDKKVDENGKESIILSAEDDANKSIHWQFKGGLSNITNNSSEGTKQANFQLANRDLYYADHKYFYSGDSLFAMTATAGSMVIKAWPNGDFNIFGNGGGYSVWCNDGSVESSITAYTNYYKSKTGTNYGGLDEVVGTFHINNTGLPALSAGGAQMAFQIYKRVSDPYASTQETNVYTDMKAHLQSDGTYNITVETYATNNLQYQRTETKRPTDYIFVLDSSGLMDKADCLGFYRWPENLSPISVAGSEDIDKSNTTMSGGKIFFFDETDGDYHQAYVESADRTDGDCDKNDTQRYLFYYIRNNGDYVYYHNNAWQTSKPATSGWVQLKGKDGERGNGTVYTGNHYEFMNVSRLQALQNAVESLSVKIAQQNSKNRIALISFGSDTTAESGIPAWTNTGLYTNDGSFKNSSGYNTISKTDLQKAFFSTSQVGTIRNLVNGMNALGHNHPSYALDIASDIIDEQKALGNTYDVNGNRNAVVVVISTGTPGSITKSASDANKSKSIANLTLDNGESGGEGGAYSLKRNGAHVYTALLGDGTTSSGDDLIQDGGRFENDFMRYLSSDYTGSRTMDDPGPLNTKENADYYYEFNNSTLFCWDIASIIDNVNANSNIAISSLTSDSVLREQITDAFDLSKAEVEYKFEKSTYDGIGRLGFVAATNPTSVSYHLDNKNNTLTVTGFDYSKYNVSEYNSDKNLGYKLIVTITGVTANPEKTLTSAAINDKEDTALYESATRMEAGQPVKRFQQYHFAIPEYTYVLDYDLPMLDTDINGTLISASELPNKQTTYVTDLQTDVFGVKFIDGDQNMLYSLNSQEGSAEDNSRAYILIQRDDGTYDWFRLNLIPASNVYYEDNKTATLASTKDKGYTTWTQYGDYAGKYQSLSGSSDIYGNDQTYGNSTEKFSLGTYLKTTVSSTNNRSETKTFTFKGTGFDLYSACGPETGIQTVTVKDGSGNIKKVFIVDTFYNDTKYGEIAQVPIVHFEGAYGDYTVETTAAYYTFAGALKTQSAGGLEIEGTDIEATSAVADIPSTDELFRQIGMEELIGQEVEVIWMDDNSIFNGGTGADRMSISTQGELGTSTTEKTLVNYIDGFRIYNPLNTNDEDYPVAEQGATYHNVISNLGSGAMTGDSLFGYVEGGDGIANFADYSSLTGNGPKNEVYLTSATNNGVTFKIKFSGDNASAKLSLRAVKGTPTVTVNGNSFAVTSTSEQYYDITGALGTAAADGTYTVAIKVSSSGANDLVAVGNLRLNNASLTALADEDLTNVVSLMTMSASPLEYDPTQAYVEPPVFADAPADDPNIDPEGSIPTLEEYREQKFEEDKKTFFDMVVDFFKTIIERIIEVLQALPALWTKSK